MFQILCALCKEQIYCDNGELDHLKKHIRKEHDIVKYILDLVVAFNFVSAIEEEKNYRSFFKLRVEITCALSGDYIICKEGIMDPVKKDMITEHDIVKYKLNLMLPLCFLNTAGEKKLMERVKDRIEVLMKTGKIIKTGIVFESFEYKENLGALPYISEDVLSKEHGENSAFNERAIHDVLENIQTEETSIIL